MIIDSMLASAADALLPERCVLCGEFIGPSNRLGNYPLCAGCAGGLEPISGRRCGKCSRELVSEDGLCMGCRGREYSFESNFSILAYDEAVREFMLAFKTRRQRRLKYFLAGLLWEACQARYPGLCLVPVPERRASLRKRGWAPLGETARVLGRIHGARVLYLLERRDGREQKGLSREERLANMQSAIRARPGRPCPVTEAVLIDDVFTTGATADACARALKAAGMRKVFALTFALD